MRAASVVVADLRVWWEAAGACEQGVSEDGWVRRGRGNRGFLLSNASRNDLIKTPTTKLKDKEENRPRPR